MKNLLAILIISGLVLGNQVFAQQGKGNNKNDKTQGHKSEVKADKEKVKDQSTEKGNAKGQDKDP